MPARKGPKKVNQYSLELKRTAVRLSRLPKKVRSLRIVSRVCPRHRHCARPLNSVVRWLARPRGVAIKNEHNGD